MLSWKRSLLGEKAQEFVYVLSTAWIVQEKVALIDLLP